MGDQTTATIKITTWQRLQKYKLLPTTTIDEIINMLLDNIEKKETNV
jgi:hypothetical protein